MVLRKRQGCAAQGEFRYFSESGEHGKWDASLVQRSSLAVRPAIGKHSCRTERI
jgi:hypothetical protein